MNYIKLFVGICCSSLMLSCSNSMDETVFSLVTEQSYTYTTKDFGPSVSSVYSYLRNYTSHSGYFCAQEASTDEVVMPPNASGWDDGGIYRRMHYHTWNSEQSHVSSMWSWFYQGALLANKVIEQLEADVVPAESPAQKSEGIAEVRAMRAFYYWQICDNFGDAPLVTASSAELPAKTSRKEIYDFVVSELTEVIPALSESTAGYYGRMNKWAAKALLANVYLNAQVYTGTPHWDECISQCNDIIGSGKYLLSENYSDPFRAEGVENNREVIFTIPYDEDFGTGNNMHLYSWHGELKNKFNLVSTPWGCGSAMAIGQFIDTYNAEDSRLADTWLMGPQFASDGVTPLLGTYDKMGEPLVYTKDLPSGNYTSEMEGYRVNKYELAEGARSNSNTDIPVFRYAEVLMMKAECLLRSGKAGAGELVTEVRKRAFKTNPALAKVTDDQLESDSCYQFGYVEDYKIVDKGDTSPVKFGRMYDELGWEFAWEFHRRRDAIRFGVYTTKSWLSHKPQGSYRAVFPIPEKVLTSNPNLEQNPDYVTSNPLLDS